MFGSDFKKYSYIYNNIEYSINIWNLHGAERFHDIKIIYSKKSDIIIYTIDITHYDINEIFINDLYENMEKKYKFIYIVLTKIDLNEKNLELCRKLAQKLIIEGIIYRYFEVSSKTGEGIESFIKCLKFDIDLSCKLNKNINYNIDLSWESDNNSFKKNLDKYLNY
jgi:tRNA U34 5-carboxymethylaminomethyl modifying GTPase MnmE/TrmE